MAPFYADAWACDAQLQYCQWDCQWLDWRDESHTIVQQLVTINLLHCFFLDHVHTVVLELDWWRHCEDLVIGEEHEVKSSSFIACTRCAAQFAIFSSWAWCFFRHFSQRSFSSCRKNKQLPLVEYNKIAAANSFAIFFCKKPGPWPTKWYK